MEYVIAHSFSQFQHERQLPQMTSRLKALEVGLMWGAAGLSVITPG